MAKQTAIVAIICTLMVLSLSIFLAIPDEVDVAEATIEALEQNVEQDSTAQRILRDARPAFVLLEILLIVAAFFPILKLIVDY